MKLKIGDLLEVTALDHTTFDGPWGKAEDLVKSSTPDHLTVSGYFIGKENKCLQLAMGQSEGNAFTTKWMIPLSTITKIVKLKASKQRGSKRKKV